ncbi:MAG: hypothetical protein IPJ60_05180 [Sphingobacteriaceae bacterium]|nr:hypothetical protein [Sphingobacteriaceae bacterium]
MSALMTRGAIQYVKGESYPSLKDYLESEKLMIKYKSTKLGGLYTNIAMIYNEISEEGLSASYLKKPFRLLN